jgi:hypothetical protein
MFQQLMNWMGWLEHFSLPLAPDADLRRFWSTSSSA